MAFTEKELQHFDVEGYVIKEGVYSQGDMQPLKDAFTAIIDREAQQLCDAGQLADSFPGEPFDRRLGRINTENPEAGKAIYQAILGGAGGGFHGLALLQMFRHEPLLDCIRQLVGNDIIASSV